MKIDGLFIICVWIVMVLIGRGAMHRSSTNYNQYYHLLQFQQNQNPTINPNPINQVNQTLTPINIKLTFRQNK